MEGISGEKLVDLRVLKAEDVGEGEEAIRPIDDLLCYFTQVSCLSSSKIIEKNLL